MHRLVPHGKGVNFTNEVRAIWDIVPLQVRRDPAIDPGVAEIGDAVPTGDPRGKKAGSEIAARLAKHVAVI
jgi:hypothetical protein